MKLYKDGITRNTVNPNVISELKKAGYVEAKDEVADTEAKEKRTVKPVKDGE